ncbi:MAG: transposase [Myxococcota bacterium]|nr:transposase [Myxococcota bacterium]
MIAFRSWGGRRAGAGRKPTGERAGVPHVRRASMTGREPVLVTLKVRRHVWSLRARRTFTRMVRAIGAASDRFGMRIVHFSVQRDHAHLIVEAESRASLVRGITRLERRAEAVGRERAQPIDQRADGRGRAVFSGSDCSERHGPRGRRTDDPEAQLGPSSIRRPALLERGDDAVPHHRGRDDVLMAAHVFMADPGDAALRWCLGELHDDSEPRLVIRIDRPPVRAAVDDDRA